MSTISSIQKHYMINSKIYDYPILTAFFPSMFFCGEATKKTSIDGLKWRDLVMVVWVGGGW